MRMRTLTALAALAAAGCASKGADPGDPMAPSAPPLALELNQAAKAERTEVVPDPHSPSRVLGYIEGDVITYRDVLQIIGPELAQIDDAREKADREDRAFLDIARERLLFRAAVDAGVATTRDEIDVERAAFVKDLAKNGGTLEAFLHEHEMSRREFDEMIRKRLIVSKYRRAAIGHSNDPRVRVRPVTDTYVPPEDVQKFYDRHPEKFHQPATARCRILAIKADLAAPDRKKAIDAAQAKAGDVVARLAAGEDWVPVFRRAMEGSGDPDPLDGLIELHRGEKIDWIEDFAFKSDKGAVFGPHQQGTTFFVLRAEGWHDERTIPFDEASADIRGRLSDFRAMTAWLEVELSVLDESSVQPDSLRTRLRENARQQRLKLLADAGL